MGDELPDLHEMDPREFRRRVHSFDFWFHSVRGYLPAEDGGLPPPRALDPSARERLVTVLCSYCVGETAALEGAGALVQLAPNREAKIFLSTQVVDEGRHLEVLVRRLSELGVADTEAEIGRRAGGPLVEFKARLLELARAGDWTAAIFAQNVILECMEFAVFTSHARRADPRTRALLEGIVRDERRHIGFGENQLGRELARVPGGRERLRAVRRELDPLVLASFGETMGRIGTPAAEREQLGRQYLAAVERLGFA